LDFGFGLARHHQAAIFIKESFMKRFFALFALVLVSASALAEDSYTLKRVYKVGEVDRYKMSFVIEGMLKAEVNLVIKETTKALKDGVATVETTIESGKISFNGQEQPFPQAGQTSSVNIDTKTGKVVSTEGNTGGPLSRLSGLTKNLGIPDRPVKIGEEIKFDSPSGDGKEKVTGTLKVASLESKSADVPTETVKLVASVNLPTEQGEKLHVDATAFVEPGTGKQLKLEGDVTGKLPMLGDAKIKILRVRMAADNK
jgi:hypothetical protein